MNLSRVFVLCFALSASAQSPAPAPELTADTVLATVDGKTLTYGEFQKYINLLPPAMQQAAMNNRKSFLEQYGLMHRLAARAEKKKLDEQSPYKESLAYNRAYVLMNAELTDALNSIPVLPADQQKHYESHKSKYTQVKVKAIYVAFSSAESKSNQHITEPAAKAKIEKLLGEIRAGTDFVRLVKENSVDKASAEKNGDFGTFRRSDNIPDAIRSVIFNLKPGQVSEPVRQPNGYYLFRAEEVSTRPYSEVKDEILNEIREIRYKEWLDEMRNGVINSIKIENQEFFSSPPPPAASQLPSK